MYNDISATSWFYESAAERNRSGYQDVKSSFAPHQDVEEKTFSEQFEDLATKYRDTLNIDIKKDTNAMISDRSFMEQYKTDLLDPVCRAFEQASPNDPHIRSIVKNVNDFWDTKVSKYTESASVASFLPISTLEFPVLTKQFFSTTLKDVIEIETTKTPMIRKHVRITYMVDNNTGEEYEYPKCLFDGTWEKLYEASRGHKIDEKVVKLNQGRLWKYDIIDNLTNGVPDDDKLSYNIKITAVEVDGGEVINLPGTGITVEFSTGGTLINGDLKLKKSDGSEIEDIISGQVDFKNGTVSLTAANNVVTGVIFSGYLSNERNLRTLSVREERKLREFKIEDGPRWNMPFTMEEIEDASALMDFNYYNRMVDEIIKGQEMHENMVGIKFLMDQHNQYNNVDTDTWALEPTAMTSYVNIQPPGYFSGDIFTYITHVIQFKLKALIYQITEATKMEDIAFVITGNPMACQLIGEFTSWKIQNGTSIGGIKVNNSYGFTTDLDANIRVVASNIYDAYTVDPVTTVPEGEEATNARELVLHIYGYPQDPEHISFKHVKYTSHLFTSPEQSAYQSTQAQGGGAYKIITATSRFTDIAIQGISADLIMLNSKLVYGPAPKRPPVRGLPVDNT